MICRQKAHLLRVNVQYHDNHLNLYHDQKEIVIQNNLLLPNHHLVKVKQMTYQNVSYNHIYNCLNVFCLLSFTRFIEI